MKTIINKCPNGWRAKTYVELNAEQSLAITTHKGPRGVQTDATVIQMTDRGPIWRPSFDFGLTLREGTGLRCIEKTVRDEHTQALADIDAVIAKALAHYAKAANSCEDVQPH